jgi:hypothetical protein
MTTVTFTQETLFAGAVRAIGSTLSVSDQDAQMLVDLGAATAPGLSPQIGSVAGALISGYAPLVSPALTGTPTAPTASAGTNTTQLATTAFVTAAVPLLSTVSEAIEKTSSTTAISPSVLPFAFSDPGYRSLSNISSGAVSGSGAFSSGNPAFGQREMYLSSLATGRASQNYGLPGSAIGPMSRADARKINFSKKIWISGTSMCLASNIGGTNYSGDSNTFVRVTLGGYSTNTTGDMTSRGIGWKKQGGSSPFFTLTVHNGTSLTDVSTNVSATDFGCIDWMIYSNGSGNVTFYINGTQVATTSAGPTGSTGNFACCYREQVEAATTPGVRQVLQSTGGFIYIEG